MFKRLTLLWAVLRGDARQLWFALRHPAAPRRLRRAASRNRRDAIEYVADYAHQCCAAAYFSLKIATTRVIKARNPHGSFAKGGKVALLRPRVKTRRAALVAGG